MAHSTVTTKKQDSVPLIFLLGSTGCGKSSFVNSIMGQSAALVGGGLTSETAEVSEYRVPSADAGDLDFCVLVDTPGFCNLRFDGQKTDYQILQEAERFLNAKNHEFACKQNQVIILFHSGHTAEIEWDDQPRALAVFNRLAGGHPLLNVLVVTTSHRELPVLGPGPGLINTTHQSKNSLLQQLRLEPGVKFVCCSLSSHDGAHDRCSDVWDPRKILDHMVSLAASKDTQSEEFPDDIALSSRSSDLPDSGEPPRDPEAAGPPVDEQPKCQTALGIPNTLIHIHNSSFTNFDRGDQNNYFPAKEGEVTCAVAPFRQEAPKPTSNSTPHKREIKVGCLGTHSCILM